MSTINLNQEFDWFATDAQGAIALFATAGHGFVPPAVVEFHVMHETVAGGIEYPSWGTGAIWDDAAQLGLFVFDWADPSGPYQRVATPTQAPDPALRAMIQRITNVPITKRPLSDLLQVASLQDFSRHS